MINRAEYLADIRACAVCGAKESLDTIRFVGRFYLCSSCRDKFLERVKGQHPLTNLDCNRVVHAMQKGD